MKRVASAKAKQIAKKRAKLVKRARNKVEKAEIDLEVERDLATLDFDRQLYIPDNRFSVPMPNWKPIAAQAKHVFAKRKELEKAVALENAANAAYRRLAM